MRPVAKAMGPGIESSDQRGRSTAVTYGRTQPRNGLNFQVSMAGAVKSMEKTSSLLTQKKSALKLTEKRLHAHTTARTRGHTTMTKTPRPLAGPLRSRINRLVHTQALLYGAAQKALMLGQVLAARDGGASFVELELIVCQMEAGAVKSLS